MQGVSGVAHGDPKKYQEEEITKMHDLMLTADQVATVVSGQDDDERKAAPRRYQAHRAGAKASRTSRSANLGGEWDAEVFLALGVEERKCKAEVIAK